MKELKLEIVKNDSEFTQKELSSQNNSEFQISVDPTFQSRFMDDNKSGVSLENPSILILPQEDNKSADWFEKWKSTEEKISTYHKKIYETDGLKIKELLEGYVSVLIGLNELIARYNNFIKQHALVLSVKRNAISNNLNDYDKDALNKEVDRADHFKQSFEKNVLEEIRFFQKNFAPIFEDIKKMFIKYLIIENKTQHRYLSDLKYE